MTTYPYYNPYGNVNEQNLIDRLVTESIKIYGMDMYYLPRRRTDFDGLYYEDDNSTFDTAYALEVYVKDSSGFQGRGSFFSKFGLEVRDRITFTMSTSRFANEITRAETEIKRPREGDLIFFPMNKRIFEIKYVDNKPFFYQLGDLQMYDMECELFDYGSEAFSTGIEDIDDIERKYSTNIYDYSILTTTDGKHLITTDGTSYGNSVITTTSQTRNESAYNPLFDNDRLDEEINEDSANSVISWDESNPFADPPDGKY